MVVKYKKSPPLDEVVPASPPPHPGGRPSKYRAEFCAEAETLTERGATNHDLAQYFEVNESTIREWRLVHAEFATAIKRGKAQADAIVEESLFRRATGYSFDCVKIFQYEGVPVRVPFVEHVPPDPTSMIFWLKNRKPQVWRDRRENIVGSDPDRPLLIGAVRSPGDAVGAARERVRVKLENVRAAERVGSAGPWGSGTGAGPVPDRSLLPAHSGAKVR
jgi:hypothetical protein